MKISILLFIALLLSSCSKFIAPYDEPALKNPYVQIDIDDSYKFITESKSYSPEPSVSMGLKAYDCYYVYAITGSGNNITHGVIVKFRSPIYEKANWLPSIFKPGNFSLESGVTIIDGITFKHSIFASPMSVAGVTTKAIIDSGYMLPDTILVKNMKEVFGAEHKYVIDIYYFEDISDHNYGYSWRGPELLGKKEKAILSSFEKRAQNALQITKKKCITRRCKGPVKLPRFNGHQNQINDEVSDAQVQQPQKDLEVSR